MNGKDATARYSVRGHNGPAGALAFSPGGDTFLTVGLEGGQKREARAILWKTADGTMLKGWQLPARGTDISFDPTGRHVAIGCEDGNVYVLRFRYPPAGP